MAVETFVQPDFTAQDAATYKASIDKAIKVLASLAGQFRPQQMSPVGMGIAVAAGSLLNGNDIAAQNVDGIGAPAANPRVDRIYLNLKNGLLERAVGAEGAVPVPPAYPTMSFPIAAITLTVGQTSIVNANIIDERAMPQYLPLRVTAGGYVEVVDPNTDEARITFGMQGVDNRVFVRTHTNEAGSSFVVQADDFTNLFHVFGNGDVQAMFKFACNGATPRAPHTLGAAATDLASALTLVNNIRTALINNGIGQA